MRHPNPPSGAVRRPDGANLAKDMTFLPISRKDIGRIWRMLDADSVPSTKGCFPVPHVAVPVDLIESNQLTPAAKLVWILLCIEADERPPGLENQLIPQSPTRLARRAGLARATIYRAFAQLLQSGWCKLRLTPNGRRCYEPDRSQADSEKAVRLPRSLIADSPGVPARARLLFARLQAAFPGEPTGGEQKGTLKWAELAAKVGQCVRAARRAVRLLLAAEWLSLHQANRLKPLIVRLFVDPVRRLQEREIRQAKARIDVSENKGEAIMVEIVTAMAATNRFLVNGFAENSRNPETGFRLQWDMFFYELRVAIEFNGEQHYGPTELYTKEQSEAQQRRDAYKYKAAEREGIRVIVIRTEDLSVAGVLNKIRGAVPLNEEAKNPRLLRYLDKVCKRYRGAAERRRRKSASR